MLKLVESGLDITEKVMYLDYLTESQQTKAEELNNAIPLEEILKRELHWMTYKIQPTEWRCKKL